MSQSQMKKQKQKPNNGSDPFGPVDIMAPFVTDAIEDIDRLLAHERPRERANADRQISEMVSSILSSGKTCGC